MVRNKSFRSEKLIKKRRRRLIIKISLFIFLFILLVSSLFYASRIDSIQIKEVEVSGNERVSSEIIKNLFIENIDGNYFFLFPKKNSLFFPKLDFKKKTLNNFIDIENINIKRDGFQKVILEIKERKRHALFCQAKTEEENIIFSNDCFFMDESAFIFSKAENDLESFDFKYFKENRNSPLRKNFLEKETFIRLNEFIENLRELNFEPFMFFADQLGDFEIYFKNGEKIIFKSEDDYNKVLENFLTILSEEDLNLVTEDNILNFLYIDLRFDNRVFYYPK